VARRRPQAGELVSLSAADPLNLAGILTPGPRLAALAGNRLLYRDGLPVAFLAAGKAEFVEELDPAAKWEAQKALLRAAVPSRAALLAAGSRPPHADDALGTA
jgi:ATP-dependent Lhr-like helicase